MSYSAALESLESRAGELHATPGQPRRKFRLEEMRLLVEALGHPEQRFRSVLIAGTNGKGSTAATLASIVEAAGYRCGLYTSPHLERVNERIQIDGQPIGDDDFARLYFRVDDCAARLVQEGQLPGHPSFFESLTALAFLAFAEAGVDLAVLEVGMGGRLDATNVVEPQISVITDVSLDHMEWLGNTIGAIAREKAGILRPHGVLVTLPQHPEANQAIGEVAVELDVRGVNAAEYMPERRDQSLQHSGPDDQSQVTEHNVQGTEIRNRYALRVMGEKIAVDTPLGGSHQQRNVALAIAAAVELRNNHGYNIDAQQIAAGIRQTRWPGRLEEFRIPGHGSAILDVAHNPAGAWALRAALSRLEETAAWRRRVLVFGCMEDKAYGEMAQILFPTFDLVVTTPVPSPRSAGAEALAEQARQTGVTAICAKHGREAFERALAETGPEDLLVVAGSVYLVGQVRPLLAAKAGPS